MQLIAQKSMRYAMRRLEVGEVFDASDKDARLLILARAARASQPDVEIQEDEAPVKKRRYRRRDMQAEES